MHFHNTTFYNCNFVNYSHLDRGNSGSSAEKAEPKKLEMCRKISNPLQSIVYNKIPHLKCFPNLILCNSCLDKTFEIEEFYIRIVDKSLSNVKIDGVENIKISLYHVDSMNPIFSINQFILESHKNTSIDIKVPYQKIDLIQDADKINPKCTGAKKNLDVLNKTKKILEVIVLSNGSASIQFPLANCRFTALTRPKAAFNVALKSYLSGEKVDELFNFLYELPNSSAAQNQVPVQTFPQNFFLDRVYAPIISPLSLDKPAMSSTFSSNPMQPDMTRTDRAFSTSASSIQKPNVISQDSGRAVDAIVLDCSEDQINTIIAAQNAESNKRKLPLGRDDRLTKKTKF